MNKVTRFLTAWTASCLLTAGAWASSTGYSIGLNFGADEPNGGATGGVAPAEVAGIPDIKQANWNNYTGIASAAPMAIGADDKGVAKTTAATVEWSCPNTWSSTGRGEENNGFPAGPDRNLMLGYLDTADNSTTQVTINNLPTDLTATGYNVYVYALGGVAGRGGGYRVVDGTSGSATAWKRGTTPANPSTYIQDPGASHTDTGDYLVFKGITWKNIIVEASSESDLDGIDMGIRAPINAVQLAPAPDKLFLGPITGSPLGFTVMVEDSGRAVADLNSITLTMDGAAVTKTSATKNSEGITTILYDVPTPPLANGGTHAVTLAIKDTLNRPYDLSGSFDVPAYTVIPPSQKLADGVIDPAKGGFTWRVYQTQTGAPTLPNNLLRTENELAGLLGDNFADPTAIGAADAAGTPATPGKLPVDFVISKVINLSQISGENNGNFGNDEQMPGIPGKSVDNSDNNIAAEILTAVEFPAAGLYTMIVNSDDGFQTSTGLNPRDMFGTLGFFNAGRGATDTRFMMWVEAAGKYAFRTIWFEGDGGANIEWESVLADGKLALLNDTANVPQALKTYQLTAAAVNAMPAYVRSVSPPPGSAGSGRPKTVEAVLVDGGTQVDTGSVVLKLNGQVVATTANKVSGVTTVLHTVVGDLLPSTDYTAELTYSDNKSSRTVSWKFKTGPLSSVLFAIEAEDFNYSDDGTTGGKTNPQKGVAGLDVDVMPYLGGAYRDLSAVEGVDYNNNDGEDSNVYRTELDADGGNEVNIADNMGGTPGNGLGGTIPAAGNDRGSWTVTANFKIGWVESGSWQNYTRTIPPNATKGWWNVYAALSYGGAGDGQLAASLDKVTSDPTATGQTTERLGEFSAPGSGDWSRNNLVLMKTATGKEAKVKLSGLNTLRFNLGSGDFDWFILSQATPPPPGVASAPLDSVKRNEVILDWTIKDTDSKVVASSVKLFLGGKDMSAKTVVAKTDTGATIHMDDAGPMYAAGDYAWQITFNDDSNPPQAVSETGKVVVNPYPTEGVFVIEAEDFNYAAESTSTTGGMTNPQKGVTGKDVDVMPYEGGAYDGLSAVEGIDYTNDDGNDSDVYRTEKDENGENEVNIEPSNANRYSNDRGVFQVVSNYKIGWVGTGSWQNYTRVFPAGAYNVWAALSYDGRGAGQLQGSLALVTSDPTKPNQTLQSLGTFNAPGSAGWSRNELVAMKDSAGAMSKVTMGGKQTVRFNLASGDLDYVLFVPETAVQPDPQFTEVKLNTDGTITVKWTGGGTLYYTAELKNPPTTTVWTSTGNSSGTFTFPQQGTKLFGRIQR